MTRSAQCSDTVLMVRPAAFGFNAEAALSNAFASAENELDTIAKACAEFDGLAGALNEAGLEVLILGDRVEPRKPDAVFPNNWVSFHADGTMIVYPMATTPRRAERRVAEVESLVRDSGFAVRRTLDLSHLESRGHFLEGTGSLILDRPLRRAFATLGPRTGGEAIDSYREATGDEVITFASADGHGRPIYHTNVMMSLGEKFALVCADAIAEPDRDRVLAALDEGDREIIEVEMGQMERFACNLLQLHGSKGPVIALSQAALVSLRPDQRRALERHGTLVDAAVPTIERVGGGSVRCMLAEVHLPRL